MTNKTAPIFRLQSLLENYSETNHQCPICYDVKFCAIKCKECRNFFCQDCKDAVVNADDYGQWKCAMCRSPKTYEIVKSEKDKEEKLRERVNYIFSDSSYYLNILIPPYNIMKVSKLDTHFNDTIHRCCMSHKCDSQNYKGNMSCLRVKGDCKKCNHQYFCYDCYCWRVENITLAPKLKNFKTTFICDCIVKDKFNIEKYNKIYDWLVKGEQEWLDGAKYQVVPEDFENLLKL